MTDLHTAAKQDIPDMIAGALGVSRGTAYDLMREALAEQPAPVQQEQVCPQKVCWTPYECENGRCTGSEKNEPVGRFNGKLRAGDGKMFFEVEVEHNKALPEVFSAIYTSPQPTVQQGFVLSKHFDKLTGAGIPNPFTFGKKQPAPVQQEPVAWRVKWPAIGGGYKWLMVDRPLMEKEGFVNEALYTSPQPAQRKPLPYNKEDMKGLDINQRLAFKLGWKSAEDAHNIKEQP